METKIVNVIKFGYEYFEYGDIVKIFTCHGKTHVGRIVYYSNSNDVQQYIKLDTSKLFESHDTIIPISEIVGIETRMESA